MKTIFLFIALALSFSISAQQFKKGEIVEVDLLMSNSREGTWQTATIVSYDAAGKSYTVKLTNGNEFGIPSRNPEKWIRAGKTNPKDTPTNPIGTVKPDVNYENTAAITKPKSCSATEQLIKQRIKAQSAITFYAYEKIAFNFTAFKQEAPYQKIDSIYGRLTIVPFKVEFTVDLLHTYTQLGRQYTEHKTWKFKRKYIFYNKPGADCEFGIAEGTAGELVKSETL